MNKDKLKQNLINILLNKYEKSKTFAGNNCKNQSFTVKVGKKYPKYLDDAEYEYFCEINEALEELEKDGLVKLFRERGNIIESVSLCMDYLPEAYSFTKRQPKKEENTWILEMLDSFKNVFLLDRYVSKQQENIKNNKTITYYDGDKNKYLDILRYAKALVENEEECYIRDFSIKLFGDSKKAEKLSSKVISLLFEYGEDFFQDKENVLEECGVVRTPTYIRMKGNAILYIGNQKIDLSLMKGDIALSTITLKELTNVEILGERVVTIENATSFYDYDNEKLEELSGAKKDFVIYLGGFHNRTKREFLRFLYEHNPEKEYRHFGDIDVGGFYILEHLKEKTGINFCPLNMDIKTLNNYFVYHKPLTENDKKRLQILIQKVKVFEKTNDEILPVLEYMLTNNCKLEQEAIC